MNTSWSDPILTCADAKAFEAQLFGGDEEQEWAAMRRAGAGVAAAALEDLKEIGGFSASGRVLVLVGKGNNGGDALLATATILAAHPAATADVVFAPGERALRPLAARAWQCLLLSAPERVRALDKALLTVAASVSERPDHVAASVNEWPGQVAASVSGRPDRVAASVSEWLPAYDLCVDGIFGFQFHPPMDAATAGLLREVNSQPSPQSLGGTEIILHVDDDERGMPRVQHFIERSTDFASGNRLHDAVCR